MPDDMNELVKSHETRLGNLDKAIGDSRSTAGGVQTHLKWAAWIGVTLFTLLTGAAGYIAVQWRESSGSRKVQSGTETVPALSPANQSVTKKVTFVPPFKGTPSVIVSLSGVNFQPGSAATPLGVKVSVINGQTTQSGFSFAVDPVGAGRDQNAVARNDEVTVSWVAYGR